MTTRLHGTRDHSLSLEPVAREPERAAIFGDDAHHVLRRSVRDSRLDLECHSHLSAGESRNVCNNFLGDPAGVAADACGIKHHTAVEALGVWLCDRSWERHCGCA